MKWWLLGVFLRVQFCVCTWKSIHIFLLNCSLTALYPSLVSTASILLGLQGIIQNISNIHVLSTLRVIWQTYSADIAILPYHCWCCLYKSVRWNFKHTVLNLIPSYFQSTYHTSKLIFWILTKQAANCLHVTTLLIQQLVLTTSYKQTLHTNTPQSDEFSCCGMFCNINKIMPCIRPTSSVVKTIILTVLFCIFHLQNSSLYPFFQLNGVSISL